VAISLCLRDGGTMDDANQPSRLQALAGARDRCVDGVRQYPISHNCFDLRERYIRPGIGRCPPLTECATQQPLLQSGQFSHGNQYNRFWPLRPNLSMLAVLLFPVSNHFLPSSQESGRRESGTPQICDHCAWIRIALIAREKEQGKWLSYHKHRK
jgi:hypothetical protein